MIRVQYFRGDDGAYARIVAGNGETVFVSEAHANKGDVEEMVSNLIGSIQRDGVTEEFDKSWGA